MDILKQFEGKINGTFETFDHIINGYLQQLHNFRLFLYYLIQKNVLPKDFNPFAANRQIPCITILKPISGNRDVH
ncbi:hypothetical protein D7V86_22695 [bacterium D16-51]|nr:hypothetical protein D7V96_22705 [bacterium D16-59]RKI54901.1 hypothetical protein D7V86_22695 [bacterium D16-51]